jgi:ABC-type Fe3+/spermidine/putrescine transport system ATPase subunit
VLKDGVLMQVGTPRELYRLPTSRFVAEFIGETNFIPGTLKHVDARNMLVETPVGPLRVARQDTQGWQEGQSVWCSVRPKRGACSSNRKPRSDASTQDMNACSASRRRDVLGETEQLQLLLTGGCDTTSGPSNERARQNFVLNPASARNRVKSDTALRPRCRCLAQ